MDGLQRIWHLVGFGALLAEERVDEIPFAAIEEVARIRESGDPSVVVEAGVPPDMVHMQMSAEHGVDTLRGETRISQIAEKGRLQLVEDGCLAVFVVADAGIDHDA